MTNNNILEDLIRTLGNGNIMSFISLFAETLNMQDEYIPDRYSETADTLLLFSLSIVKGFSIRGEKTYRTRDSINACKEMMENPIVMDSIHKNNIEAPHTKREILETRNDPAYAIKNAASYFLYVTSEAKQIAIMSYCMDVLEEYLGVRSKKVTWLKQAV